MQKPTISFFFLFIFMMFMVAPTIISVIEKSFDTSIFYSVNEEENKVNETLKTFEVKLNDQDRFGISTFNLEKEKSFSAYIKNYVPHTVECFSPPPELS